jgi:hypothetical protein
MRMRYESKIELYKNYIKVINVLYFYQNILDFFLLCILPINLNIKGISISADTFDKLLCLLFISITCILTRHYN